MKFTFALGGLIGFMVVMISGITAGSEPAWLLAQACFGALVGGLLFRWLGLQFIKSVHVMRLEKTQTSGMDATQSDSPAGSNKS